MTEFCEANGIAYERCGKVIVATQEAELPRLEALYERGVANGVPGLERIEPARLREIEPHANALRALHSPNTAIVDFGAVARSIADHVTRRGAEIRTLSRVGRIAEADGGLVLITGREEIRATRLINCGGLHSDVITAMTGERPTVRIIPFRGEYYMLRPERRHLVRGLIYPVPDPEFPFLGVHFTRTIHGEVEAGPNAVLAFAREGYTAGTINLAETLRTIGYRGFWAMTGRYWKTGCYEFYRSLSKRAFVRALKRLVPDLRDEDVTPGGAGVRAQAVTPEGALVDDFAILPGRNAIHVLNAPSPAATASLAIGRDIAHLAADSFSLKT
jgi:L-2-hydroxyglutarate oxidase LhgO